MTSRFLSSAAIALLAMLGTTSMASASSHQPDLEEVAIGTFLVALGVMVFLAGIYAVKHAFGLDRPPPPESDAGDHGAHH